MKISADGVFSRLEEMEIQQVTRVIKLSQLPLPGKIRAVYQTIGRMPTSTTSNVSVEGLNLKDQLVPRRRQECPMRSLSLQKTFCHGKSLS